MEKKEKPKSRRNKMSRRGWRGSRSRRGRSDRGEVTSQMRGNNLVSNPANPDHGPLGFLNPIKVQFVFF